MALMLLRKEGEQVVINGDIIITVLKPQNGKTRLAFDFKPPNSVLRKELLDKAKANGTEGELYLKRLLS